MVISIMFWDFEIEILSFHKKNGGKVVENSKNFEIQKTSETFGSAELQTSLHHYFVLMFIVILEVFAVIIWP